MNYIYVIGTGPGNPSYIPPAAREVAAKCCFLVGGERLLELFNDVDCDKITLKAAMLKELPEIITGYLFYGHVGILASGDPGVYSILNYLLERFDKQKIIVVPGISSLQYTFARMKRTWEGVYITSTHGKTEASFRKEIKTIVSHNTVFIFTCEKFSPSKIAHMLLKQGETDRTVTIGENLSYPGENVFSCSLQEIKDMPAAPLSVMVVDKK